MKLTPRETQVAELVAAGLNNRAIARQLNISVGTVENNINFIGAKAPWGEDGNAHGRVMLAKYIFERPKYPCEEYWR